MGFEQRDMVTRNEIWIYFNDDWMDFNGIQTSVGSDSLHE